ncbi:MAG: intermembrane transport protein PqiB [Verrucomicrobiaceae bacterium]
MINEEPEPTDTHPAVKPISRFNRVWIIPIIALFLGAWLVKRNYDEQGEIVTLSFENAEGITEGKTEVKCRNVKIGVVEKVALTDSLQVQIALRIMPTHLHLVREDSQFWVVKPRVQGASVSGLNTLLSGAYIELDPGLSTETARHFTGLETPPLTPNSVPGLRLTLSAKEPGSIDIGSGIYFKETQIGKVESRTFKAETQTVEFGVFIEDQFRELVTDSALFWRSSGISLHVGAEGFDLEFPSLESFVAGRITMGTPVGMNLGEPIDDLSSVNLYPSKESAENSTFRGGVEFLLLLDQSLRGLKEGSPVEFRGLRVGRVGKISYSLVEGIDIEEIPVLVQLDTRLLATHFPPSLLDEGAGGFENALKKGLRASLKNSSLITGQLYVDLDYYPDAPIAKIETRGDRLVLPTIHTGLESLQDKVLALLDKLNQLEIESLLAKVGDTSDEATRVLGNVNRAMVSSKGVVADAQTTLKEMTKTMESINTILSTDDTKALSGDLRQTLAQVNESLKPLAADGNVYGDLRRTMDELRAAIRSIDRMTTEIADKPNSLLFGKDPSSNKIPRARR